MSKPIDHAPRIEVRSRAELREWLRDHHQQSETVWLVTYKKHSPHYLSIGASVDELLCFGWIDSRMRRVDEDRMERLISPRRADSIWSIPNKDRVEKLRAEARMMPAGEKAVRVAVENGMWSFLDDIEALVIPEDLDAALTEDAARGGWESLAESKRKQLLYWIKSAKTAKTRASRIANTAEAASEGRMPQGLS
ncbi:MAG: YdeI/OmpD-associated family protein [Paracoccaceae bacterium]|nr:YdeI/OmpD-associated family protein [Paracoccaceae bacterium]